MEFVQLSCSNRKKKKLLKERRKLRERVELKMDLPGVSIADSYDSSMFSLSTIKKQKVKTTKTDRYTTNITTRMKTSLFGSVGKSQFYFSIW